MQALPRTETRISASLVLLAAAVPGAAQLPAPNAAGVSTGHIHLTVPDTARHAEIWRQLGAESESAGPLELLVFPGTYLLLAEGDPTAPSIETSANHIGFSVRDYADYKRRLEGVGAVIFYDSAENGQILADLPDGVRVEFLTDTQQSEPIVFHHVHLAAPDTEALRDWYTEVFGAEPGERRGLPSAIVPGGRVDIMGARGDAPQGSRGAAIDHIGFEVTDMAAFAARMETLGVAFDLEPRRVESIGLTIAFLTDPVGTYIEVTEGLADLD